MSRSLPVILYHNYRTTPFSAEDACQSCFVPFDGTALLNTDPVYPLIQSLFHIDGGSGATQAEIINQALQISNNFTYNTYSSAFLQGLKRGIFRSLIPPVVNWLEAQPPTRYIISPELDRQPRNANFTKFLLWLVGGYNSPSFVRWFQLSGSCCTVRSNCQEFCST